MTIIQTDKLIKSFADNKAVDDVTIHVRAGEIYGFLGLNGAGKTTTIKLLLGMIRPDAGSAFLFGKEVYQARDIWNQVGYLVESPYSYPDLSVRENLEFIYRLRELNNPSLIDAVIQKLNLSVYEDKKVKHLSTGNNQRLGLAKALLHHPKLLILDEPTNGLDPAGIVEVRDYLKDLVSSHNTTIFISSHILSEISKLATRIGIIHEGKLVKEINTDELEKQINKRLRINAVDNHQAVNILNQKGYNFNQVADDLIETEDEKAIYQPEKIATLLVNANLPLKKLNVIEEDLESYFLRIIGE